MPRTVLEAMVYIVVLSLGSCGVFVKLKPDQAILGILGTLCVFGLATLGILKLADLGVLATPE